MDLIDIMPKATEERIPVFYKDKFIGSAGRRAGKAGMMLRATLINHVLSGEPMDYFISPSEAAAELYTQMMREMSQDIHISMGFDISGPD